MLLVLTTPEELDIPQILAIYRESSMENCQGAFPAETDAASLEAHLRSGFVREKETWNEGGKTFDRHCTMAYRSHDRSTVTGASNSKLSGVTRQS